MTTEQTATDVKGKIRLAELPYGYDALEPALSAETMRYHHDKHLAGYVDKVNELIAGTRYEPMALEDIVRSSEGTLYNNAAQVWNHNFYFESLSPTPQPAPAGALAGAVDSTFGSFAAMKEALAKACTGLFGSGWVWLVADRNGRLEIMSEPNAGNPLRHDGKCPLLAIDVWEHAYYIDYRNRRADSVAALWNVIDWKKVGERYNAR